MDKFNSIPIPQTEYQNNLKKLDRTIPEQFLEEFVIIHQNKKEVELTGKEFYEQFIKWSEDNNVEYNTTPLKLGVKISLLKDIGIKKGRHTMKGETKYYNILVLKKIYGYSEVDPFEDSEEIIKPAEISEDKPVEKLITKQIKNKMINRLDPFDDDDDDNLY